MPILPERDEPLWLSRLTAESIENGPFPIREILRASLFYPASGFDGDPVKYLGGHVHSFIYADYGVDEEAFEHALRVHGVHGYRILGKRAVYESRLVGRDGDPGSVPPEQRPRIEMFQAHGTPFCTWVVFERLLDFDECDGPFRFSLLYWQQEGLTAFQRLYVSRRLTPSVVAIIQPGYGFGGNWTDFFAPEGPLASAVLSNPAGQPGLLLCGGDYVGLDALEPCWPGYEKLLCAYPKTGGGSVGVWKRGARQRC